ncbi:DedA family protein [Citrobacter meridianamericanus]|uniref:VTT domain-containing protein n=1 Tax=Citrobacter meridianamericanus TaxID=2894201 RepID=A0ABT1B7L9_9ENTR|nr:VTT domain-containing protein [Citrobacter meridianamericanus]MCO5781677.1 VTT domain-containing protein [Citrobacter meridianamericanus]
MEWVNALMNHFALHPFSLWGLLFGIAFAKSTFLISAVLPPASVMLVAVISVGKATLSPWEAGIAVMIGAWCGTIVNYHLGMMMGHLAWLARIMSHHADTVVRVRRRLQNSSIPILFTSRFIAVLRYIVPLVAGMLRLHPVKVYVVSLISAASWSALYVGGFTLVLPFIS